MEEEIWKEIEEQEIIPNVPLEQIKVKNQICKWEELNKNKNNSKNEITPQWR